ncbi:hypothetical protein, partial [Enterococcus malodoratus]|uniref:hypothetical protein n=1 Tax=Enterococcus malodoratus TaxID=71451 RepID=UPI002073E27D
MSWYGIIKLALPFLEKYSFFISLILFSRWLYKRFSKAYLKKLENNTKLNYERRQMEINRYNATNPEYQVQITSGWIDSYKYKVSQINNTLLLSFVFAYISFNTTSYLESSNENFFKL